MTDIYKTKEIETNINERGVNLGNVDVTLYTMDKGSAAFKVYLKREVNYANEKVYDPVNLYTTDMTPRIDIVAADGSVFANEPIDIVIPENGVIQYIVSDYVIRHAGKMDVYIYLENKSESVQVANFYFYIEEDGVARRLGKEITGGRLEDVVKNVMSGQLMELLSEDFREQLEREIKSFLQDHNKDFNLRFEDLTREEKDELMKNLTNQGLADFRIEDNSISNVKLIDGTIKPEKTSFFNITSSNNLLDLSKVQNNTSIDLSSNIIAEEGRWLTDYIPLDASTGEQLNITTGTYRIGTYDANKKPISRRAITNDNKLVIENTSATRYVRVSGTKSLSEVMINKGESLLPYEQPKKIGDIKLKKEYYDSFKLENKSIQSQHINDKAIQSEHINDKSIQAEHINDGTITPEKTSFFDVGENMFDLSNVEDKKTVELDGSITDSDSRWLSGYIEVPNSKIMTITDGAYRVAIYDEDKNFVVRLGTVAGENTLDFTDRDNVKYIRLSGTKDYNEVMLNEGSKLKPYSRYYAKINNKYIPSINSLTQEEIEYLSSVIDSNIEIEDNSITTSKVKDNAITSSKIKDGTIQPEKTSFFDIKTSNNLLDLSKVLENTSVDLSSNVITEEGRWLTDYIPLDASKDEKLNITEGSYRVGTYDENKNPIGRRAITKDNNLVIENTSATRYVRVSGTKDLSEVMINKGDALLPYEKNENQSEPKIQQQHIPKITPDNCTYFEKSHNLFNKKTVLRNKKINFDGSIIDQENWVVSDKILANGSLVSFTTDFSVKWSVFNKNDELILTGSKNSGRTDTLNLPIEASYFIVSVVETTLDRFMVNYGANVLPYEEFGYTLVSTNKTPITISSDIVPIQSGDRTVVQVDTITDLNNTKQISNEVSEVYISNEKRNIYSTTKTSQLDYVEISTNSVDAEIVLSYSDEENNTVLANTSVPGELEELPLTLQNIVEYGYPNVEYLYYDPKKASYKIALKNLNFSNGFELSIRNSGASTINITTKIVGRYYV
ncbi:BppU family phage baseplate upper protein [Staphylococcus epidermidis]|nr:BppU family phage baseplate upper protein [Staphylococcus epidermidis]